MSVFSPSNFCACISRSQASLIHSNILSTLPTHYLVHSYENIVTTAEKKKYDVLDHRKVEFEDDYLGFKNQIESLQLSLQTYMDTWFERSLPTDYLLRLLEKFSSINGAEWVIKKF